MKQIFTFFTSFLICFALNAQTDVVLRINHKLDNLPFQTNVTSENNLGNQFRITRLLYYITRITVIHDGGQNLAISDDTVALVRASSTDFSDISLGNLNVTSIEGIKFHIGVYSPANNADPSLYPAEHPLAPQSPSMHWGWASGYRFLVVEGNSGINFAQLFQLHALGNDNYFETQVTVSSQDFQGSKYISVDANYEDGLYGIELNSGVIAHGVDLQDLEALINFRDRVFTASTNSLNVNDLTENNWNVYPNPALESHVIIEYPYNSDDVNVIVTDSHGRVISSSFLSIQSHIYFKESGIYFVQLTKAGENIGTKKIVVL